jgi:hypothetical protein
MSTDQGDPSGGSKSDPTAVILYKAPTTAPIPTFFGNEPPIIDMTDVHPAPGADAGRDEPPVMPRAARLGEAPRARPEAGPAAAPGVADDVAARARVAGRDTARPGRFTVLAASVALAACLGAVGGSLGYAQLQHPIANAAPSARLDPNEEIHALKETVAQLRASVKTIGDTLMAMRTSSNASNTTIAAQLAKITEAVDRAERSERRAAVTAPPAAPETTGSITGNNPPEAKPAAKPAVVEGWVVRKIYDGAALIEGRYGMVEVEPGMVLPGLGRIHEIKRQDGRWVVVTAKGLIMPVHP